MKFQHKLVAKARKLSRNQNLRLVLTSVFDSYLSDILLFGLVFVAVSSVESSLSRVGFLSTLFVALVLLAWKLDSRRKDDERELERRLALERSFNTVESPKESAFWVNKLIRTYWEDVFEPLLADTLFKRLSKMINKAQPSFIKSIHFDSFALGSCPPSLDNLRILGSTNNDVKTLELDVDFKSEEFRWILRAVGSEAVKLINGVNFTFSIDALEIRLRIRLYLFKHSNIMLMSLISKPTIYNFHANLLGLSPSAIPFFDIRKFLEGVISSALVEPKRVPISLAFKSVPNVTDSLLFFDVVSCNDIKIIDRSKKVRKVQVSTPLAPRPIHLHPSLGAPSLGFSSIRSTNLDLTTRSVGLLQLRMTLGSFKRRSKVVAIATDRTSQSPGAPGAGPGQEAATAEDPHFNERFQARIAARKAKVRIRLFDVTESTSAGEVTKGDADKDAIECLGEKVIEMTCAQTDTTTYWLKDPNGVPICKTLHKGDKGWSVTCPLESKKAVGEDLGTIRLVLYHVSWQYVDAEAKGEGKGAAAGRHGGAEGAGAGAGADAAGRKSSERLEPHSYVLKINRAKDLVAKDSNGLSDPYFKIRYGTFTAKSEVVFKTLNPVWNETFVFEQQSLQDKIKVKFMDRDKLQDESLGDLEIPVVLLKGKGGEKIREWRELSGVDSGSVLFELSLRKGLPTRVRRRGITMDHNSGHDTLSVTVHRARHLKAVDRGGASDPYCTIEYSQSVRKSEVIKKTTDPLWDFSSDFDYEGGEVKVSVYDWNLVLSKKLLGHVKVPVRALVPGLTLSRKWFKLADAVSGEVLVTVARSDGGDQLSGVSATSAGGPPDLGALGDLGANLRRDLSAIFEED